MTPRRKKSGKSAHGSIRKPAPTLGFSPFALGQQYQHLCPERYPHSDDANQLGPPLSIRETAALIGSSTWTIRQKYLPMGLPHFRVGSTGKLTFYKNQVIRWVITQQQKGAML
jgi:hypothetical protein